ncbi:lysophosphatidic acid receptor 4 [Myripristis murdjan]|uniref:Lysophosphatidic acid receptor 4-like n=1 Tax=Myripristis murdjan TaxID=586833 RepID=A0A668ADU6_9TELE|nr:lysophosphatidic acid receptor 4-like [Myripristis murdjan]
MSAANSSGSQPNDTTGHADMIFVSVYSIISVVGFVLNVMALVVFFRHAKSRSHTTVYMTNLAIADLVLILSLPMRIYHHLGFPDLPQRLCDWAGLILLANMYGSIILLTCICFDRCMAVTFPMSHRVREGRKKAPLVCVGVWILTFSTSVPIYLFKSQKDYKERHCFGGLPIYIVQPVAFFPTLSIGFGIPLTVMLICSWGLLRAIRQSTVAQTELVDSKKIQRMIAASLLIFLLSFLPYHTVLILLYHNGVAPVSPALLASYQYSLMVACLNAMLDPIVYYFTTSTFREKVDMEAMRKMVQLNSHSSMEANSKNKAPINT